MNAPTSLLHPGLNPADYRTTPLLRDAATWQARILVGNSMSDDHQCGDWDQVGYVMVAMRGEPRVIPVALSDEHDQGFALLHARARDWGINPADWFPISTSGGGLFLYSQSDIPKAMAALRRWHEAGGGEVLVRSTGQGNLPGRWRVDSRSFLAGKGTPQPGADGLLPLGQRFAELLRDVGHSLAAMRDPDRPSELHPGDARGFHQLRKAVTQLARFVSAYNEFSMPLSAKLRDGGRSGSREDIMAGWSAELDTAVLQRDADAIERMLFTHNGLKNCIHMEVRREMAIGPGGSYGMGDLFGDLVLANDILGGISPGLEPDAQLSAPGMR